MSEVITKQSRIGKLPVPLTDKVKVAISGSTISVEGPKGKLEKSFSNTVSFSQEDSGIVVVATDKSKLAYAMQGTARSIVNGMVEGVTKGFEKNLIVNGVGFRAAVQGNVLDLALGYSHPVKFSIPAGIKITVTENTKIKVEGIDKQLVGQVAATIFHYNKAEPYKAKGVQIVGQFVRRKEGKKSS